MDKDRVKKYLKNISDNDVCVNCSVTRHLHDEYPMNACKAFTETGGLESKDGEERKDGWIRD